MNVAFAYHEGLADHLVACLVWLRSNGKYNLKQLAKTLSKQKLRDITMRRVYWSPPPPRPKPSPARPKPSPPRPRPRPPPKSACESRSPAPPSSKAAKHAPHWLQQHLLTLYKLGALNVPSAARKARL